MCLEEFRKEPATLTLIIINIVVFLMVEFTGLAQDTLHMLDWGAAYTPLIVEKGEVYRLFTSMFLHFGIEHLINNMLVLFVLGDNLERALGKVKYLIFYLLCGIGANIISLAVNMGRGYYVVSAGASGAIFGVGGMTGSVLSLVWDLRQGEYAVSAGASGAVFAVMGAMIYVVIRNKGRLEDLSVRQILVMAVFSLYFGFASSGVDNAAHTGGLAAGFLLAVFCYHRRKKI